MFASFKMSLPSFTGKVFDEYYAKGKALYDEQKRYVKTTLDKYLSPSGSLMASEIEKDWFPAIRAAIFLSHSHKDEKNVIAFAGFLSDLGLFAFIDSCVWGYANDLLKMIDDAYCVQSTKPSGGHTYNYDSRNYTTAHVHMILNGALLKMMDRTECLIFLDTPNSLKAEDLSHGVTNSGWIYSELLMSGVIEKKEPIRKSAKYRIDEAFEHNALSVEYDVDISHLIKLSLSDIVFAARKVQKAGTAVLDQLCYSKKLLRKKNYA